MRSRANRRGFTLIELGVCVAALGCGACVLAVNAGWQPEESRPGKKTFEEDGPLSDDPVIRKAQLDARAKARLIKDSTQVRGIHQGMVLFAQNNKDRYPLPSVLDTKDMTVKAGHATEKDATANIMSILIYNGFFGPELCVSPAESNDKIEVDEDYAYDRPKKAVVPGEALWDPAFSANFTDGHTGNFSYAHLMPSKSRYATWSNTFNASEAAIGNRGPKVTGVKYEGEPDKLRAVCEVSGRSKTFAIHGGPEKWEGNISFNDNHVNYETDLNIGHRQFKDVGEKAFPDAMFFNEENDPSDSNTVLGIFTHAGVSTKNFRSIWD